MVKNNRGDQQPPLPELPQQQDVLDQAIEEILGKENPAAYSIFTAVERIVRQFKLDVEAHGLLFDAYLRGKKALQQGKEIQNPQAWLRGSAYNIAREKSRKQKRVRSYSPEVIDVLFSDEGNLPLERAILEEEMLAAIKAMRTLQKEKPDTFNLIHQRVVEEKSWQEIQSNYANTNQGKTISESALRQRYSRGRKHLRSIFHRVTTVNY
ncbi:MAG: sigma-70 family RNA polymerase sigma factor [Cyanobacteria bacterium J06626_18]